MLGGIIQRMIMIESPERIKPRHSCLRSLLPVYPPEFNAVSLVRLMQYLKISVYKIVRGKVERYTLLCLGILTYSSRHIGIHILKITHAVGGVKVERYL